MLTLKVLGTNGLFPDDNNPTSGYLLSCNDLNYLVDVGSGVFNKVTNLLPPENLDGVIITHYHFDHVSDIGVLSYYLQTKNKKLKVYGPDDGSYYQKLITGSPYFDFTPIDGCIENGDLKICFYKMNHSVLTYGVTFESENKKFAYTSDSNLCEAHSLLLKNADLAVINCGCLQKDWNEQKPVLSAYHAGRLAKEYGIKALISHFNPALSREDIISEAKSQCPSLEPAEYTDYLI